MGFSECVSFNGDQHRICLKHFHQSWEIALVAQIKAMQRFVPVLVLPGIELIFFLGGGMVLWYGMVLDSGWTWLGISQLVLSNCIVHCLLWLFFPFSSPLLSY